MKWLLFWPIWIAQIFSTTKSFKANPVLGNPLLNRLGLHVGRVILAHWLTMMRHWFLAPLVSPQDRRAFLRDGYVVKADFLPPAMFSAVDREARKFRGEARECHQGDSITSRVFLDDRTLSELPACRSLAGYRPYGRLLKFCAARNHRPFLYVQEIRNHAIEGGSDPQRILHSDTFHPTIKAWLFLDDVDDRNGPFTFVPGSQRLTRRRLAWEYRKSLQGARLDDGYSQKGSLRLTEPERKALGLPEPVAFRVRKNTLVVANTHGFHCRGPASDASSRLEIWAFSRTNPFNPFIGLDSALVRRFEQWAFKAYLRYLDKQAMRRGVPPSWRLSRPQNR